MPVPVVGAEDGFEEDRISQLFVLGALAVMSPAAYAAGGIPQTIDYYEIVAHHLEIGAQWVPTIGGVLVLAIVTLMGLYYRAAVAKAKDDVVPSGKFSLRFVLEGILEFLYGLTKDNCGHDFRKFMPFLSALFIFILTCNLSGLVPGFPPPTESMDTNVAMG